MADRPKGARRRGGSPSKRKKVDASLPGAKRARRKGGICLSDDDEEAAAPTARVAEPDEAAEEEEAHAPAHASGGAAQEDAKPKPKSAMDDLWEEMKRGESAKKPAAAPKTDIGSFINGLVSKSSGAGAGAAQKGGKFDVASLFPTSVTKKQIVKVQRERKREKERERERERARAPERERGRAPAAQMLVRREKGEDTRLRDALLQV